MIFLDFDGVLFDTAREAFVVASLTDNKIDSIQSAEFNSHAYQLFSNYRYLIDQAWNYSYLMELIYSETHEKFEERYYNLIKNASNKDIKRYENSFFSTRSSLKEGCAVEWMQLNKPFPFLNLIKPLIADCIESFLIVTTKDKETVKSLLLTEGVMFPDCQIYDKEHYSLYQSKAKIIQNIVMDGNVKKSLFIDDNAQHLHKCRKIKFLEICQAGWGYVSPNDSNLLTEFQIIEKIKSAI